MGFAILVTIFWAQWHKSHIKNTLIVSQSEPAPDSTLTSNFHWLFMVKIMNIS